MPPRGPIPPSSSGGDEARGDLRAPRVEATPLVPKELEGDLLLLLILHYGPRGGSNGASLGSYNRALALAAVEETGKLTRKKPPAEGERWER